MPSAKGHQIVQLIGDASKFILFGSTQRVFDCQPILRGVASELGEAQLGDQAAQRLGDVDVERLASDGRVGPIRCWSCMAGTVGNRWSIADFAPMDVIPTGVSLTSYSGDAEDFVAMPLQQLIDQVASGDLPIPSGRVFHIDNIVEAHRTMEANSAGGKIVVLTR